jgi:hypothetical protein
MPATPVLFYAIDVKLAMDGLQVKRAGGHSIRFDFQISRDRSSKLVEFLENYNNFGIYFDIS